MSQSIIVCAKSRYLDKSDYLLIHKSDEQLIFEQIYLS